MSEFKEEFKDYFGSTAWKGFVIGGGLLLAYILAALFWGVWPFSVVSGLAKKVVNPTAIIQNYEYFEDQFMAIKSTKKKIEIARRNLLSSSDKVFAETNLSGLEMILADQIAEYNSRSSQITRNMWKNEKLPREISE